MRDAWQWELQGRVYSAMVIKLTAKLSFCLWVFSLCSICAADSGIIWGNNYRIKASSQNIIFHDFITKQDMDLITPEDTIWATYGVGQAWALEATKVPSESVSGTEKNHNKFQRIWHSTDFIHWTEYGRLNDLDLLGTAIIIPLDNDRLFLSKKLGFYYFGDAYYSFIIVKKTGSELTPESGMNLDFGSPFSIKSGVKSDFDKFSNLAYNRKFSIVKNIQFELPKTLFQFDDKFVLGSLQLGIFWVFDLKGDIVKRCQIYKEMDEDDYPNVFQFDRAVIGCAVSPNNSLLLAAKVKEAVWFTQSEFQTQLMTPSHELVPAEIRDRNIERGVSAWPDIQWFEIDVDEGKTTLLSDPIGAPIDRRKLHGDSIDFEFNLNQKLEFH